MDEPERPIARPVSAEVRIRISRLLGEATGAARSIEDPKSKALALAAIARALAASDPHIAAQLLDEAERGLARWITESEDSEGTTLSKARALTDLAMALAKAAPDRAARLIDEAERLASSIDDKTHKADALKMVTEALTDLAMALAKPAPDRAARLLDDAERLASSISDPEVEAQLVFFAGDPDSRERLWWSAPIKKSKAAALAAVARALAATNPDRAAWLCDHAGRLAYSIHDKTYEADARTVVAEALADLAKALTKAAPDRATRLIDDAERLVHFFVDENFFVDERARDSALQKVTMALAEADPDRAERLALRALALLSFGGWQRMLALAEIGGALATDPNRTRSLVSGARSIREQKDFDYKGGEGWTEKDKAEALAAAAEALTTTAPDLAARFLDDAERLASSIAQDTGYQKATALAAVAAAWGKGW